MSKPDMTNYFDTPSNSPDGNDSKLVIGGSVEVDGQLYSSSELKTILNNASSSGVWDYSDLATTITPITLSSDVSTLITNDGSGAFTNDTYGIDGVDIYNPLTNSFDFRGLSLGSTVGVRIDLDVTTDINNTELSIYMQLGSGLGMYSIPWSPDFQYKSSGVHRVILFNKLYIGSEDTMNSPAQFFIKADGDGSVKVNGWFVEARKA